VLAKHCLNTLWRPRGKPPPAEIETVLVRLCLGACIHVRPKLSCTTESGVLPINVWQSTRCRISPARACVPKTEGQLCHLSSRTVPSSSAAPSLREFSGCQATWMLLPPSRCVSTTDLTRLRCRRPARTGVGVQALAAQAGRPAHVLGGVQRLYRIHE
jgi:hypothetical protein